MDASVLVELQSFRPAIEKRRTGQHWHLQFARQALNAEGHVHSFAHGGVHSAPHGTQGDITNVQTDVAMHFKVHVFLQPFALGRFIGFRAAENFGGLGGLHSRGNVISRPVGKDTVANEFVDDRITRFQNLFALRIPLTQHGGHLLSAELGGDGGEVAQIAHEQGGAHRLDRQRDGVERLRTDVAGSLTRGTFFILAVKNKGAGAKLHTVPMTQSTRRSHGHVVDEAAVGTAKIGNPEQLPVTPDGGVLARHPTVHQSDAGIRAASDQIEVLESNLEFFLQ